jgi:DNA-binding beta-propeller fold protein YncE
MAARRIRKNTKDPLTMTVIVGEGDYRFEFSNDWAKVPSELAWVEVADVTTDSKDQVYVFNRGGRQPVMVFDRDGNYLRSWGEGLIKRAHGAYTAPDDTLWLTDDGNSVVYHCTLEGKILLTLGVPGEPQPYMSLRPFNRCTHTAMSPEGDVYVSDGYGNAQVHKYSPDGKLLLSWGEPGTETGQFNVPHNVCCDADGWVYVADRESHRIQVFNGKGKYETQWNNLHRPNSIYMRPGKCHTCYIGEGGPAMSVNAKSPGLGPRITITDAKGKPITRIGDPSGSGLNPGQFMSPHGLTVDSKGSIYVGEVGATRWAGKFPGEPLPKTMTTLRKLRKLSS